MTLIQTVILSIILSLKCSAYYYDSSLIVKTLDGRVQGTTVTTFEGKTVTAYFGIPYAVPPLENLRFKPPLPVKPWNHVLNASKKSDACIQVPLQYYNSGFLLDDIKSSSEDCLYLNIWIPNPWPNQAAVMIWIHGGGFEMGTGISKRYDGHILASVENVIVVTINYRLSFFGFLYSGDDEAPGNVGLMDQALAISWIKRNIIFFGGEPNRITIFGESAGAVSVGLHLITGTSKLFRRAILQSGSSSDKWVSSSKVEGSRATMDLANRVGCMSGTVEVISCLRNKTLNELVEAGKEVHLIRGIVKFTPVIDGMYIMDDPKILLRDLRLSQPIELLLGSNTGDGSFMAFATRTLNTTEDISVPESNFDHFVNISLQGLASSKTLNVARFMYSDWMNNRNEQSVNGQIINFGTDFYFNCAANLLSNSFDSTGNRVYRYVFSHMSSKFPHPKWLGATHGADIDFVFGWPLDPSYEFTQIESSLSRYMMKYWANFAKRGNPLMHWPQYNQKSKAYINLSTNPSAIYNKGISLQRCAFWDYIEPVLSASCNDEINLNRN